MEERDELSVQELAEEDLLRADFYGFIAHLLAAPPVEATLARLCQLQTDDTPLGRALSVLSRTARGVTPAAAADEFKALFIGLTEGELRPYASYYLTGFLYEKPLAALRYDLERLGVRRAGGVCEPEDHIASLCETMRGLIVGAFRMPAHSAHATSVLHRSSAAMGAALFRGPAARPAGGALPADRSRRRRLHEHRAGSVRDDRLRGPKRARARRTDRSPRRQRQQGTRGKRQGVRDHDG